jgi:hypothetical protein
MAVATVIAMGNDRSMTKDEQRRLAIVEQKQDATEKNIDEIKAILIDLRDAYQRGKGAYWAFIKIGVIATALISIASAIVNYLPIWIKH